MRTFLAFCLLNLLLKSVLSQETCEICHCDWYKGNKDRLVVDCSGRNLTEMLHEIPGNTVILNLSDNNLNLSDNKPLPQLSNLKSISLANNGLHFIPKLLFENVPWLEHIDFSGNIIQEVRSSMFRNMKFIRSIVGLESEDFSEEAFSLLQDLQELSLVFHQHDIPSAIFNGLKLHKLHIEAKQADTISEELLKSGRTSLSFLSLKLPRVTSLNVNLLLGLTQLKEFKLEAESMQRLPTNFLQDDDNKLSMPQHLSEIVIIGVNNLPWNLFRNQLSLERLAFHNIENLPFGIFNHSGTLDSLDLSGSHVPSVPPDWFVSLASLKILILKNTSLTELNRDALKGLNSLTILDLSNNKLRSVCAETFAHVKNTLVKLDLSGNELRNLSNAFSGMFSLEELNVSENKIDTVSENVFSDLGKLTVLRMNNNQIWNIPEYVFFYQRSLLDLNVSTNNLTRLPPRLLENARSLKKFDISNNPIATFPTHFFANVRFLESLVIENNPLHCDCHVMILNSQYNSRIRVEGTCVSPEEFRGWSVSKIGFNESCLVLEQASTTKTIGKTSATDDIDHLLTTESLEHSSVTEPLEHPSTTESPREITENGPSAYSMSTSYAHDQRSNVTSVVFSAKTGSPRDPNIGEEKLPDYDDFDLSFDPQIFYTVMAIVVFIIGSVAVIALVRHWRKAIRSGTYVVTEENPAIDAGAGTSTSGDVDTKIRN